MKKVLLSLIVTLTTSIASAQFVYFKGSMGPSFQSSNSFAGGDISYDPSFLGTLTLASGYHFNPIFSSEVELAVRSADIDGINGAPWLGDLNSSALMFNGNIRLPVYRNMFATFGAGLGFMSAEIYDAIEDNYADGSSLAAQFMIVTEFEMSGNFSVTFEYRRFSSLDLEFTGTDGVFREDFDYTSGAFLLGGKVSF